MWRKESCPFVFIVHNSIWARLSKFPANTDCLSYSVYPCDCFSPFSFSVPYQPQAKLSITETGRLSYEILNHNQCAMQNYDLFVVKPDGKNYTLVINNSEGDLLLPGSCTDCLVHISTRNQYGTGPSFISKPMKWKGQEKGLLKFFTTAYSLLFFFF